MRQSMTGFAAQQGEGHDHAWTWELRGVNGKGLDLRLRLPDWVEGLEAGVRAATTRALARGNVQISLRLSAAEASGMLRVDPVQLKAVMEAMVEIETEAMERGLSLAPSTAAEIVALRGVLSAEDTASIDTAALCKALLADYAVALNSFVAMRKAEGAQLAQVLSRQLDDIADLAAQARQAVATRAAHQSERLAAQLARVMDNADAADPDRVAQELALIAVKSDVTEELDRLDTHVTAARDLLAAEGPVGRKLDFLMQEFNREANTLCSKSGDAALTQVGLSLKTVIDQLREQVQNVE